MENTFSREDKSIVFNALKIDDVETLKSVLVRYNTETPELFSYQKADGDFGSFLSFAARSETQKCFEYMLSLPWLEHIDVIAFYQKHGIWFLRGKNNAGIKVLWERENIPFSQESFFLYFTDTSHYGRPYGNALALITELGVPVSKWKDANPTLYAELNKFSHFTGSLFHGAAEHGDHDAIVDFLITLKKLTASAWGNLVYRGRFLEPELCKRLHQSGITFDEPNKENVVKAFTYHNESNVNAYLHDVIPTEQLIKQLDFWADIACSTSRYKLFEPLLMKCGKEALTNAILNKRNALFLLNDIARYADSENVSDELQSFFIHAQLAMLTKHLKKQPSTKMTQEQLKAFCSKRYTKSQRIAVARFLTIHYDYGAFCPFVVHNDDWIDAIIQQGRDPFNLLGYIECHDKKAALLAQLSSQL